MARVYQFPPDPPSRPAAPTKLSVADRLDLLRRVDPKAAKVIEIWIDKAYRAAVARAR